MESSAVDGIHKEKTARITDAMADLQLGIEGLNGQLSGESDGNRFAQALGPFARFYSVFLKTVLGDRGERETGLLDDRVLESMRLQFNRLRKILGGKRREIKVGIGPASGFVEITKRTTIRWNPREPSALMLGHRS